MLKSLKKAFSIDIEATIGSVIDLLSNDIVFSPRLGRYNAVLCAASRFSMKLHT